MTRRSRLAFSLIALFVPAIASGQSITRDQLRYQLRQADCREAYRARTERDCDERCRRVAEQRRDRCLADAERRYIHALRIQMRPPD